MSAGGVSGRVALVTGAAGTMGTATAMRLAADGYRVALVDIAADRLSVLAKQIGNAAVPIAADLSTADGAAQAVAATAAVASVQLSATTSTRGVGA